MRTQDMNLGDTYTYEVWGFHKTDPVNYPPRILMGFKDAESAMEYRPFPAYDYEVVRVLVSRMRVMA